MISEYATPHEPSYPSSGMFGLQFLSFRHCRGPVTGAHCKTIGEERELFFNLL